MKNNTLIATHLLKPEAINRHQLTLSLITEGARVGVFNQAHVEKMQIQLVTILNTAILEYTHQESNSVKTETAHNIFQSILYCCDYFLLSLSLEDAATVLLTLDFNDLYFRGLQRVKDDVDQTKIIEAKVQSTMLDIPLIAYNDSINESIPDFWQNYDEYYDAHNTPALIDYPLLKDDMSWAGILYIKNYLEKLLLENEFALCFSQQEVIQLLENYGEKYCMDYREMLINITEQILKNVLCSALLKKNISLSISEAECTTLEKQLKGLTENECRTQLEYAMQNIFVELQIANSELQQYLKSFIDTFSPQLVNAIRTNSLAGLIVIDHDHSYIDCAHYYRPGENLSDEQLRLVIDELQHCQDGQAKFAVIKSEIHSLEDLIEVLGSYCIFDEEYNVIFSQMEEHDLAVLVADLRDDYELVDDKFVFNVDRWHRTENELYWQKQLISYLLNANPSTYENVLQLSREFKKSRIVK